MRINWNKKNIIIAIILLVMAAAFGGWLIFNTFKSKPTLNQGMTAEADLTLRQMAVKEDILKKVNGPVPLSPAEKQKIFNDLMGAKIKQYHFSNEELAKILRALNK